MSQDAEIARWRAALRAFEGEAPAPERCPPAEQIWDAVTGTLPATAYREVADHTVFCPACAQEWRFAAALAAPPSGAQEVTAPRFTPWRLAVIAATLLLAMAGTAGLFWRLQPPVPVFRHGAGAELRSRVLGQALSRQHCVLRWSLAGLPAASFDLTVATADGRRIAHVTELRTPEYRVPPEAWVGLGDPVELEWRIRATLEDGTGVESVTFHNMLR